MFQSTPPHGGRPRLRWSTSTWRCFNPRPRMGGDHHWQMVVLAQHVSIHAPAWGATNTPKYNVGQLTFQSTPPHGGRPGPPKPHRQESAVSIHAPAWGATSGQGPGGEGDCFNPRPRMGGDSWGGSSLSRARRFNPRPRMGGDRVATRRRGRGRGFNPRPRMGGDDTHSRPGLTRTTFQSTPPHGGRLKSSIHLFLCMMFQSTPPHGGRLRSTIL